MKKTFYIFVLSALVPLLIWIITILPDLNILKSQLSAVSEGRSLTPRFINLVFSTPSFLYKTIFLIYLFISLAIFSLYFLTKKNYLLLLSLFLAAAWIFAYYGKIEWYTVYIPPFIYIASILAFASSIRNKKGIFSKDLKIFSVICLLVLFILGLNNYLNVASDSSDKSYTQLEKKVREIILPGKNILLSSIPDLYFAFNSNYRLYEFPVAKTNQDDFKKLLSKIDYVVMNTQLSNLFVGDTLDKYLEEETEKKTEVTGGGYKVYLFELKHKKI